MFHKIFIKLLLSAFMISMLVYSFGFLNKEREQTQLTADSKLINEQTRLLSVDSLPLNMKEEKDLFSLQSIKSEPLIIVNNSNVTLPFDEVLDREIISSEAKAFKSSDRANKPDEIAINIEADLKHLGIAISKPVSIVDDSSNHQLPPDIDLLNDLMVKNANEIAYSKPEVIDVNKLEETDNLDQLMLSKSNK